MKVKKIILAMVSTLIVLAIALQSNVFATTSLPEPTVKLKNLNYSEDGITEYSIGINNGVDQTAIKKHEIADVTNGGKTTIKDAYCAWADKGFEKRATIPSDETSHIDTYTAKYDMNATNTQAKQYIKNADSNVTYDGVSANKYKAILELTNLFLLEEDDYENYIATTLKNAMDSGRYSTNPGYQNLVALKNRGASNVFMTAEQIRAVQQFALWYFTEYGNSQYMMTDQTGWIQVRDTNETSYTLSAIKVTDFYDGLSAIDNEACDLYNYLIRTAIANANNNVAIDNNVYLYTNPTDANNTQPIIMIKKVNKEFDLALRKFITKVNGNNVQTSRVPDTSSATDLTGNIKTGEKTAKKAHTKDAITIRKGDRVLYTIRVYNEGEVNGFADVVTDYLPAGLDYITNSTINQNNGWTYDSSTRKVTTTKLASKELTAANRDWTKFNGSDANGKYYTDLQIECSVNSSATSTTLKNVAEITQSHGTNGKQDVDSTANSIKSYPSSYKGSHETTGRGIEDDDDFEDLKLNFDLALRKYITKVEDASGNLVKDNDALGRTPSINESTITSTTVEMPTTARYNHKKSPVSVQRGYYVYYTLAVYNEGDIAGHATQIKDQLPANLEAQTNGITSDTFELDNYDTTNNIVTLKRKSSAGVQKAYEAGKLNTYKETVTIKCKVKDSAQIGKIHTNIAWISGYYNKDLNQNVTVDLDSHATTPSTKPSATELVTSEVGYTGGKTWTKAQLANNNFFYGQEDEDDFEKIIITKGPDIHKGVKTVENQDSGYNGNEEHKWVINSTIPGTEDIDEYIKYFITDDIDSRLVFSGLDKVKVSIINDAGAEVAQLVKDTDYKLTYTAHSPAIDSDILGVKTSGTLKVIFAGEGSGFSALSSTIKANAGKKIKVEFNTTFAKENGKVKAEIIGKNIPNKARLQYTNNSEPDGEKDTEKPEVHTGGISLYKYEKGNTNVPLQGAEFKVYKTQANAQNRTNEVATATSGTNGLVTFTGLQYGEDAEYNSDGTVRTTNKKSDGTYIQGTASNRVIPGTKYYIVETKAPTNYRENTTIREVTIDANSYKTKIADVISAGNGVENTPKDFDLALRKFITKIQSGNTTTEYNTDENRVPKITGQQVVKNTETNAKETTTAEKSHTKDKLQVAKGDKVTYTIRIYNEGEVNGYAAEVTDYLPAGLSLVPKAQSTVNTTYNWVEGTDANGKAVIKSTYLKDNNKVITAANYDFNKLKTAGYYQDLLVECIVNNNATADNLKNIAAITKYENENGKEVTDKDSDKGAINRDTYNPKNPTKGLGEQDDDDFEDLKLEELDLALRKFITRVADNADMTGATTYNRAPAPANLDELFDNNEVTTATYNHTKQPLKVSVGDYVEYTLRVYNEGSMDGYARQITDHLPEYLEFVDSGVNKTKYNWTVSEDGRTVTTDYLNNTKLNKLMELITVGAHGREISMDSTEKLEDNELKIICKVNDKVPADVKQTNIAEITKYGDKNNTPLDVDRDSQTTGNGKVKLPTDSELPDYKKTEIERGDKYIPGQQDDDDFEKIYVPNFDLALRKFITQVDGQKNRVITDRIPEVKYDKEAGKITYNHPKDPVMVVQGDVVTYTLRIFNEGKLDGYASMITDDIPDGVEFLPDHATNKEYKWVMYAELPAGVEAVDQSKVVELNINGENEVKKYIETTDPKAAKIVRTDYLSRQNGIDKMKEGDTVNPNLLKAFDPTAEITDTAESRNPDYRDIKVAFRVTEKNGSERILINYAQISEDEDENGKPVKDIDSTTDRWIKDEDDQDIEKIKVPNFDLALRKWVTQAIVTENGKTSVTETGHDAWDDPEEIVKVELHRKKLSNVTVKFRYSIRVYNQGEIEGYAKEVKDHIPEGLKFVAEDNPDWKDEGNNVITTKKLENTLLKPGEFADVEVLLTWINGNDNLGLKINYAEISKDFNDWGVPDKDSTPDNMKEKHEDDDDEAPVMLSVSTGHEVTYIILGTAVLVVIAGGIALIKKYVM